MVQNNDPEIVYYEKEDKPMSLPPVDQEIVTQPQIIIKVETKSEENDESNFKLYLHIITICFRRFCCFSKK